MMTNHLFYLILFAFFATSLSAQGNLRPSFVAGLTQNNVILDGLLNEADWQSAPLLTELRTTVPEEGGTPSVRTEVRVLAHERFLVFGIVCYDPEPEKIIRFSKLRDTELENEDHIRIVIDPFLDGQSGYIFAVNANGARYDALVSNRGESENPDWDAVWEAITHIGEEGWSVEIKIPIQSINFKKDLFEWGFNIERRVQRFQETIRWANVRRDQWFTQTSRAGLLTNLPAFNYGIGLTVRPSLISSVSKIGEGGANDWTFEPSLDASQRIGPNVLATLTVNTDFAETEVDTRQTNLTRFPLFFPEKRSFFLEGADIFEFGFGTGSQTVLPFFSRRIGLSAGTEIPVVAGTKLNGRIGKTAFGGVGIRTNETQLGDELLPASNMGVMRVRQNVLGESSAGIIATVGDPLGRDGSWMGGADFTYQTTSFKEDKNFLIGGWALSTNRADLNDDRSAFGFKIDYPNDRWDAALIYARIGDDFNPSLGFVQRQGVHYLRAGATFAPRPKLPWLRQMFFQFFPTYIQETNGKWQTYRIFTAPINWRLESGDRIEFNVFPRGERITEPFAIADEVNIPVDEYHFIRYRIEGEFAAKRRLNGQLSWWFGSFYEGKLDEIEATINWNPYTLLTFEFSGQRNIGRLPWGDFDQTLLGLRVRLNVTPDLQLNSYLQYDTDSETLGINARIHWIYSPLGDAFLVLNHNTRNQMDSPWELQNRQVLVKVRYNFRV